MSEKISQQPLEYWQTYRGEVLEVASELNLKKNNKDNEEESHGH